MVCMSRQFQTGYLEEDHSKMSNAVDRLAETFDLLATYPRGLLVTELAQLLETNKSTSSRLLASLVEAGLVERDAAQRHFLDVRFWNWGIQAVRRLAVVDVARPHIIAAAKQWSVPVYLAIARGDQTIYLQNFSTHHGDVLVNLISYIVPIYACAPGKSILSFSSDEVVESVLSGPLTRFTAQTHATRDDLAEELATVRRQGYAINRGEYYENGHLAVAVPVFDHSGSPVASLCFYGMTEEEHMRQLIPPLVELGETVSSSLGFAQAIHRAVG